MNLSRTIISKDTLLLVGKRYFTSSTAPLLSNNASVKTNQSFKIKVKPTNVVPPKSNHSDGSNNHTQQTIKPISNTSKDQSNPKFKVNSNTFTQQQTTTNNNESTKPITSNPFNNLNNNQQVSNTTFVSSHYKSNFENVLTYLDRKKLIYRQNAKEIIVKECPFCPDTKNKLDNLWKLYISKETSGYFCFRCGAKGSWYDFKANLGDLSLNQISSTSNEPSSNSSAVGGETAEKQDNDVGFTSATDMKKMAIYSLDLDNHPEIIQKLTGKGEGERGLELDVCKFYKVGVTTQSFFVEDKWEDHKCITFPWTTMDKKSNVQVQRCKLRSSKLKALQRIEPKGGKWGFFGWHTVPESAKEIILTEGEYDAMAVYQATGKPTISLPNGANSLPIALLPLLERFEKIYLWMDDDVPGQEGAQKFADKLGIQRTYIVKTRQNDPNGPKDANDALLQGKDLNAILASATNIPHDQICDFSEVRSLIFSELQNPDTVNGVKSIWIPSFNKLLLGHRKGELTIFSGSTGIGKTTLLSQMSLDFCAQGTRTLWGSFELKVSRLARKMMGQYAGVDLEKHISDYNRLADEFSNLPMYFLRFFGSSQIDKVIDAMDYAVYVHDVQHIVLDNLQFMLGGQSKGIERFEIMDEAIEKLRLFASQKNVHITVVIHPRKNDDETSALTMNDIFGTAKATQEADNVIILQRGNEYKYLDIRKNRFNGKLGTIPLTFNTDSLRFLEPTNNNN